MYKILIIDDEILIRELIKKSIDFNALGFEIVGEAKDGRQAMEMIEALHPNLLLLDINIPIINNVSIELSNKSNIFSTFHSTFYFKTCNITI